MRRDLLLLIAIALIMAGVLLIARTPLAGRPMSQASPAVAPSSSPTDPPAELVLEAGDSGLANFTGGTYRISWDAGDCTAFWIQVAPLEGPAIPIEVTEATGSLEVEIPAGNAWINRGGSCPGGAYTVRLVRLS